MFWSQVSSILVLGWSYLAAAAGWAGGVARSVKNLSIRLRGFYNVLDVLPNLFLEVLIEFLQPKQNQFGPTWLQNRSKFHEHLVQNRSWAVLGAKLQKCQKVSIYLGPLSVLAFQVAPRWSKRRPRNR